MLKAHENKWMCFLELASLAARKTRLIGVINKTSQQQIGVIEWYGAWRQYCFMPAPRTVFNEACLFDIRGALLTLMIEHKDRSK